jgi:hypothetical protein
MVQKNAYFFVSNMLEGAIYVVYVCVSIFCAPFENSLLHSILLF